MVQKYQSPVRVYKYPFELVMEAYERRFPTCPLIPVFVGCEVLSDEKTPDGSQRFTERRCKLVVEAPYIIKKIIGTDYVFFIQKNDLNLKNRNLDIEAQNESFTNRVTVLEKCRYFAHPENPEWTCFEQSATLDVKSFFGFENTIEKLAMKQYVQNVSKGKEIIEHFINVLKEEGITHVPPWIPPENYVEPLPSNIGDELGGVNGKLAEVTITTSAGNQLIRQGSSSSNTLPNTYHLEADYIQRYLGELTPIQESQLVQLKNNFAHLQKGKIPNDPTLLRFLRARDFNVEKARELLSQSLTWRKRHNVDQILSSYETPDVIKDYFPGGWHHHDKDDQPIYLLKLGQMDVKGLLKTIGEDSLLKLTMHVCEEGLKLTEKVTKDCGKPISTWCLLVDLEGLNMRHLWRPGIKALLRIIEIVEANYPETLGRVLIIRAPRVFPILWTLINKFIDEKTRSKFLFYGGNDYQAAGGLVDYIDEEFIPDFLGGPCKTKIPDGGIIPKHLYQADIGHEGACMTEDSIYSSAGLSRNQSHEVFVLIEAPGSVITWDFDIIRHEVAFSVLYLKRVLPSLAEDETESTGTEQKLVFDKSWKEGTDYVVVEPSTVCHEGESIQGSHVTAFSGMYILSWRHHASMVIDNILDTITNPKAEIMYYYEVLHSADYKGSMSSLQSGHSGFSALSQRSIASVCPSR
ncbi:SEC14-like protein 1 isoform X2 [Bemisia tabaci]|uniref:SEC14-like protein 1 isoform X2 n=1 Tax=Bemisia tabaci TaxID=7038 RepID=UPI0008F9BC6F|nr:PREDICTED: SEC14-like protein 1 isoform X1 [Bemisia tabaci]